MENYIVPDSLIPPLRFNAIQNNLFRGAYPREINFVFLKTLNLKTIISLTPQPITNEIDKKLYKFTKSNEINLIHIEVSELYKKKKILICHSAILIAIDYMIHKNHSPLYIHCIDGGQITSLFISCLRKIQFWTPITIFNEFINFNTNITVNNRAFVESFRGQIIVKKKDKVDWLWTGISKDVLMNHSHIKIIEI